MPNAKLDIDYQAGAAYAYDSSKRVWANYDTPDIAKLKAKYAVDRGLAGTFAWVRSDRSQRKLKIRI